MNSASCPLKLKHVEKKKKKEEEEEEEEENAKRETCKTLDPNTCLSAVWIAEMRSAFCIFSFFFFFFKPAQLGKWTVPGQWIVTFLLLFLVFSKINCI